MATKIKRIEDLPEEELNKRSGKMYGKIMPSPEPGEQKPLKKMAKGGTSSSRADGCATKGKTRGKVL